MTRHCGVCLQIRAFVSNPHSTSKQELNQSPLAFLETASEPGLEEALKRKDNIIRVRNAQISALWDELHTRQPWKNAIKGEDIVSFPEDAANTTRKLAVLGINTVSAVLLVYPARASICLLHSMLDTSIMLALHMPSTGNDWNDSVSQFFVQLLLQAVVQVSCKL